MGRALGTGSRSFARFSRTIARLALTSPSIVPHGFLCGIRSRYAASSRLRWTSPASGLTAGTARRNADTPLRGRRVFGLLSAASAGAG